MRSSLVSSAYTVNAVVTRLISPLFKVGAARVWLFHVDPEDIKLPSAADILLLRQRFFHVGVARANGEITSSSPSGCR